MLLAQSGKSQGSGDSVLRLLRQHYVGLRLRNRRFLPCCTSHVNVPHPYHSWERGTNENPNGLLGQYLHKSADLTQVAPEQLRAIVYALNRRPRKCLGSAGKQLECRHGPETWATLWVPGVAFPSPCSWSKAKTPRGLGTEPQAPDRRCAIGSPVPFPNARVALRMVMRLTSQRPLLPPSVGQHSQSCVFASPGCIARVEA